MNDLEEALNLDTDEEFMNDEEFNGAPIYGRDINGSFGVKVQRSDLGSSVLLILKASDRIKPLVIVRELFSRFELNFITAITRKIKYSDKRNLYYVSVTYNREIERFMNSISSVRGHFFNVDNICIQVKSATDIIFSSAKIDTAIQSERIVKNLHFNHVPNTEISPTHNIIKLLEIIDRDDAASNSILGVSLRLDQSRRFLYSFGSFILSPQQDLSECLSRLIDLGFNAHRATFSSFILPKKLLNQIKSSNSKSLMVNEFLKQNNLLTNLNTIDVFSQGQRSLANHRVPQLGGGLNLLNHLNELVPNVIRETMRRAVNHRNGSSRMQRAGGRRNLNRNNRHHRRDNHH
jgi:hypothetical protein